MPRRSLEYFLALAFLSVLLLLFTRRPSHDPIVSVIDNVPQYGVNDENPKPIRQISILGERNSGTRWTYEHVHECFGHAVKVEKQLTRYKHWFQYDDPSRYPHDTLVLAQFRNPYDWLKAMERVPHHAPAHLRLSPHADVHKQDAQNDWTIFLSKPWTMERQGADLGWDENKLCQENFRYQDLVSCIKEPLPHSYYNHTLRYSEHQPFYEHRNDGSGQPYANIMEMRSDKIRNFLNVANYQGVAALWVLQYEFLLARGTQKLIDRIAQWTNIQPACQAKPPQERLQKKSRMLSADYCRHVRMHLNWTVEAMIGFEPDERREEAESREW